MQRSPFPRDSAEDVTLAIMYPVALAIGLVVASPIAGAAWRLFRWAAGW